MINIIWNMLRKYGEGQGRTVAHVAVSAHGDGLAAQSLPHHLHQRVEPVHGQRHVILVGVAIV